jgi:uncharacterized membrane protein YoaK (UPF0700 family)
LRRYILHNLSKNRERLESGALALVLPFVAGAVNASGFFIVGAYTSHVTGSVARVGDELAQGHAPGAIKAGLLVVAFYLGATLATALVERARHRSRPRYVDALLAEASMLLVVTMLGLAKPQGIPFLHTLTTSLLCLAMGAQNALVTKLSGAVVRTTHLTGIVTDLGIETIRAWQWLRTTSGGGGWQVVKLLARAWEVTELKRLRLHLAILGSFFSGAVAGPLLYLRFGLASMLFPVMVLLVLVLFDSLVGLRSNAEGGKPADPRDLLGRTAPVVTAVPAAPAAPGVPVTAPARDESTARA